MVRTVDKVRASAPQLEGVVPYDPKYLPARAYLSANENPSDVDLEIRRQIESEIRKVNLNRYPDPLANELREMIADANGLERDWVLIGNGGDELLFNTALAWGGPGRTFLNLPPTFSVYANNARITGTETIDIPRLDDDGFSIDEARVLELARSGDAFDFTIIATPNNPTGLRARPEFMEELLDATDALVMADEAYFEFSRNTMRPYLDRNANLVILRTFSKAFSLAGVRIGYILAHPDVIREYIKVRQPYSVDAISQAVARVVFRNRSSFEPNIKQIISERERVSEALRTIPGIHVYPSDSNWVLFKMEGADRAWQYLYDKGTLIRDLSSAPMLEDCLRVTIGTEEQNDGFLAELKEFALNA